MGFMDKMKNTADKVGKKVEKGIKNVSDSSQKFNDKVKIKKQITQIEDEINAAFTEIGKRYFAENADSPSPEYAEAVELIKSKSAQRDSLTADLNALEDKLACPGCGALVDVGQKFCDKCGARLPEPPAPPAPEPAAVAKCPKCGADILEGQRFCEKCGANLAEAAAEPVGEVVSEAVETVGEAAETVGEVADTVGEDAAETAGETAGEDGEDGYREI